MHQRSTVILEMKTRKDQCDQAGRASNKSDDDVFLISNENIQGRLVSRSVYTATYPKCARLLTLRSMKYQRTLKNPQLNTEESTEQSSHFVVLSRIANSVELNMVISVPYFSSVFCDGNFPDEICRVHAGLFIWKERGGERGGEGECY